MWKRFFTLISGKELKDHFIMPILGGHEFGKSKGQTKEGRRLVLKK